MFEGCDAAKAAVAKAQAEAKANTKERVAAAQWRTRAGPANPDQGVCS